MTYGPHRDEDAPDMVVVRGRSRFNEEETVPVHPGILAQRRRINELAAGRVRPLTGGDR